LIIYFNRKIFSICSQNKEEVNREALIQYLEAMIQLERRRNSTDTNKTQGIFFFSSFANRYNLNKKLIYSLKHYSHKSSRSWIDGKKLSSLVFVTIM